VLYCSPTMELASTSKVSTWSGCATCAHTRQLCAAFRRAGRSGQPAVVLTYCATGSARRTISGAVRAWSPARSPHGSNSATRTWSGARPFHLARCLQTLPKSQHGRPA
jgi:hypothetical protein